jgi:hypothetical protein
LRCRRIAVTFGASLNRSIGYVRKSPLVTLALLNRSGSVRRRPMISRLAATLYDGVAL